jgi:hypothetical protein
LSLLRISLHTVNSPLITLQCIIAILEKIDDLADSLRAGVVCKRWQGLEKLARREVTATRERDLPQLRRDFPNCMKLNMQAPRTQITGDLSDTGLTAISKDFKHILKLVRVTS